MKRFRSSTILIVLAAVTTTPVVAQERRPDTKPQIPQNDCVGVRYWGKVTDVTKSSIAVQCEGELPKEFAVSDALAGGQIPMKARPDPRFGRVRSVEPSHMYRLVDVKVGDLVIIEYAHLGSADICDHIRIVKRTGGRVPPLPVKAEKLLNPAEIWKAGLPPGTPLPPSLRDGVYIPYHEKQNAHWDLVDKGIPYPEKFGELRRWPVAPSPREVKSNGSPAKP